MSDERCEDIICLLGNLKVMDLRWTLKITLLFTSLHCCLLHCYDTGRTRRFFDVNSKLFEHYGRQMDVETTLS